MSHPQRLDHNACSKHSRAGVCAKHASRIDRYPVAVITLTVCGRSAVLSQSSLDSPASRVIALSASSTRDLLSWRIVGA